MADTVSMEISGMDDLINDLKQLATKYPDRAGELLKTEAKTLRKNIVKNAKDLTDTSSSSKRSLGKAGSYSISTLQGFGKNQSVDISAKAPHFHLVEHGHTLKTHSGKTIGFVQGRHFLEKAVKQYEKDMPDTVKKMIDELLKEGGFV